MVGFVDFGLSIRLLSALRLFRRNSARGTLLYAVTTVRVFQILQFDVHVKVHR